MNGPLRLAGVGAIGLLIGALVAGTLLGAPVAGAQTAGSYGTACTKAESPAGLFMICIGDVVGDGQRRIATVTRRGSERGWLQVRDGSASLVAEYIGFPQKVTWTWSQRPGVNPIALDFLTQ